MKILKDPHHSPMFLPLALMGKMRLVCTVMVYFDLDDPETPLPDREMWPQVMKLLPSPPVLDPGLPKPRAEVLAAGKCFAPDGKARQAAQVSMGVGGVRKVLDVFGDRHWVRAGGTVVGVSDPAPFTVMPLTWERAFGGAGEPRNPKGLGMPPDKPGEAPVPLPNVQYHGQLMGSPQDRPEPASFLPRDVMHPERQNKAGTYDDTWKRDRWPYYPDDLNPEFFLGSPPDQWGKDYFKGGEAIEIVNMHPKRQLITSRLPQFTVRLFMTRKEGPKAPPENDTFEEVPLRIDTLWLFPEAAKGVVVFRGVFNTERDDMADVRYAYVATEPMGQAPGSLEHHLEVQTRRIEAMKPVAPVIPDANLKVNRELLKFNRVYKDIAKIKAKAMGQVPVMAREPGEMAAMGRQTIAASLATLDSMEAMAVKLQDQFGWRAVLDPASFAPRRAALEDTAKKIDAAAAKVSQVKAKAVARKADMQKDAGARLKAVATPGQLANAGIDPDNLLPDKDDGLGPWHASGFPFVTRCRRALEGDPALTSRLKSAGFTTSTLSACWIGYNAEPAAFEGADWGLPRGAFTIPAGLTLPRFEGKKLTRILVLPGWPGDLRATYLAPGSDPAPLWLAAPDETAPVIVAATELEANLLEQEVGDVCHVAALASPAETPSPAAAKAVKTAPAVLVAASRGSQKSLSGAAPWLALSDKAQWLTLAKGADCLEARAKGEDLRELIFDALPRAAVGLPEDEPEPPFGPAPAKKRPALPDIGGLVQSAMAEVKAFHQARFDGLKARMKDMESQVREALAKQGKDYDRIMAEAKAAPRTPADQLGARLASDIRAKRDAFKAQGILPPGQEAEMTKAAAQAEQLGADSEARFQEGRKKLAEAAKKVEAAKSAKPGEVPEDMKAQFKKAGMDLDAMVSRTREEVVAMHAAGRTLSGAILSGVDLSGLDLSGADFTGCRLGRTNFTKAVLDGCTFNKAMAQNADFTGASLKGARFEQAMLTRTSFKKALLSGADLRQASLNQADLEGADLEGADMRLAALTKSNLTGAVFSGARLNLMAVQECQGANSVWREAQLERVLIRKTILDGADFTGAVLASSQIQQCAGRNVVFAKAVFKKGALADCRLPGCDFTGAQASTLHVRGSTMPGADFRGATLSRCRIENSSLTQAQLSGASARGTSFPGSDLEGADLSGSDLLFGSLSKTRIVGSNLAGANCFGVDFHKAVVGKTRFTGTNLKMTALEGKADLLEQP
ncbi:DUF2169 domain-containing protein [Fundidesulfovibrio terrae]|uniref:DUF2169 domain-containing protein n=1 Tax=Fundidesulfovibrio terrae TaxID=2922866 RepID=UPI001FAEBC98|nr:DUF2169 domain-containing protein [Fundidesulfovibrio terrae]